MEGVSVDVKLVWLKSLKAAGSKPSLNPDECPQVSLFKTFLTFPHTLVCQKT